MRPYTLSKALWRTGSMMKSSLIENLNWHAGVIGIVASRMRERIRKPRHNHTA